MEEKNFYNQLSVSSLGGENLNEYRYDLRTLPIGSYIHMLLVGSLVEVEIDKDGFKQRFFNQRGLLLPNQAVSFEEVLQNSIKVVISPNSYQVVMAQRGHFSDGMVLRLTKTLDKGQIDSRTGKPSPYYNYDHKILGFNADQINQLREHYRSPLSDYIDPNAQETQAPQVQQYQQAPQVQQYQQAPQVQQYQQAPQVQQYQQAPQVQQYQQAPNIPSNENNGNKVPFTI